MKFQSKKDRFFTVVVFAVCGLLIAIGLSVWFKESPEEYIFLPLAILSSVIGLLLWFFFGTAYEIREDRLYYQTGPIRGSMNISEIREIVKGDTQWVGLKVATARQGLILKYNRFDEIYISPENDDRFIHHLLELKPDIVITQV